MANELQLWTALCQNENCRKQLGKLHIPVVGGKAILHCQLCKTTSSFEVVAGGIRTENLTKTK